MLRKRIFARGVYYFEETNKETLAAFFMSRRMDTSF
jgi:hypothetical protein